MTGDNTAQGGGGEALIFNMARLVSMKIVWVGESIIYEICNTTLKDVFFSWLSLIQNFCLIKTIFGHEKCLDTLDPQF